MGFGTLFIGYALLLNVTYYGASDVFAGLIMLLGLMKLSTVNSRFAEAKWVAVGFSAFGLIEFVLFFLRLFSYRFAEAYDGLAGYVAIFRYVILAALTVLMLFGMRDVAREVGLDALAKRCGRLSYATLAVYALWVVLDLPFLAITGAAMAAVYFAAIVAMLVVLLTNLVTVYGCYMRICMPGEEHGRRRKPSRFAFVNEYRERQEARAKEEEEYRREQIKKRAEKKRKGRK